MQSHLLELLKNLTLGGSRFIVCGGVASVFHGLERLNLNLDISLDLTSNNLSKTVDILWQKGLRPRVPIPETVLKNPKMHWRWPWFTLTSLSSTLISC
jgi:hypothetical protein